jgi:hypothetical protein
MQKLPLSSCILYEMDGKTAGPGGIAPLTPAERAKTCEAGAPACLPSNPLRLVNTSSGTASWSKLGTQFQHFIVQFSRMFWVFDDQMIASGRFRDGGAIAFRSVLPSFLRFSIENAEFVPFFVHFNKK